MEAWFCASDKIKATENATAAEVSIEFRWSTGTVWWDDISLESCPGDLPRNIKIGTVNFRPPGPTVEDNVILTIYEAGSSLFQSPGILVPL